MREGEKSWDKAWEEVFRKRKWGRYPPEELVRFMARRFFSVKDRSKVRVLELGCGGGACTWFMAREGFDVYAVDGAEGAIKQTKAYLESEGLEAKVVRADFLKMPFEAGFFDAAVDVASIQQTTLDKVKRIGERGRELLKPGGAMFAMMVARGTWGDGTGTEVERNTYRDIPEGPYHELGTTHFFERKEIEEVFRAFSKVEIEKSTRTAEGMTREISHWVVAATK